MTTTFIAAFKKIGNSINIIIPKNIVDFLEIKEGDIGKIEVQKIDRDAIKITQLREKYIYEGADGKIFLSTKPIGTIDKIFFNTLDGLTSYFSKGDEKEPEKKVIFINGILFGKLSKEQLNKKNILIKALRDYSLPLRFEIDVKDKDGKRYHMITNEYRYVASKGFILDNFEFHVRVDKFINMK